MHVTDTDVRTARRKRLVLATAVLGSIVAQLAGVYAAYFDRATGF